MAGARELLEHPTLMIYVTPSDGRLFLGQLPTANNRHLFEPITMQITCMGKSPEQRGGITLPGARLFQFELVNAATRDAIGMSCLEYCSRRCVTAKEPWSIAWRDAIAQRAREPSSRRRRSWLLVRWNAGSFGARTVTWLTGLARRSAPRHFFRQFPFQ